MTSVPVCDKCAFSTLVLFASWELQSKRTQWQEEMLVLVVLSSVRTLSTC